VSIVERRYGHHTPASSPRNPAQPGKVFSQGITALTSSIRGWWKQRLLERVQHLNNHLLDDIGVEREPECRTEALWKTEPPP
jgi:uncharacterized protein YjiS (DUF1127 family)